MRIRGKSIAKASIAFILLTVLPLVSPSLLPSELYNAISIQAGVDLEDLLNRIAVVGVILTVFLVLRGSVEKMSQGGLALSTAWKIFLLVVVIFILSIGKIENTGLAILSSQSSSAQNMVIFDLRLFVVLVTAIIVLMIARSVLEYKEYQNQKEFKLP